jgi:hypothetical protein
MYSDPEDKLPRQQPCKRNRVSPAMLRAGEHSKYFRRNSNQFPSIGSKKLTVQKEKAGGKGLKYPVQDRVPGDDWLLTTTSSFSFVYS